MTSWLTKKYFNLLLVILATVCWSSSGIFISQIMAKSTLSSVNLAFWRDLITFITLGMILLLFDRKGFRVKRKDIGWLAGMGVVSIGIFHVFWNVSVITNGVGVATIVQSNAPLFVTVMAYLAWREPLTPKKVIALVLGIIGTLLITDINAVSTTGVSTTGIFIGLGSALTYGTMSMFGKKFSSDYSAWTVLFYAFAFAALVLLTTQVGQLNMFSQVIKKVPLEFAGLIFFPTVFGFWLYNLALKNLEASIAAITATSEVLFAALASFLFLNERLQIWQIVGGVLIIAGVILISLPRKKRAVQVDLGNE